MRKILLILFIIFIAVLLFINKNSISFFSDKQPIRIGINPWPGYEYMYVAQALGFYKKLGLEVEVVEISSLTDVRIAYERGHLDVFGTIISEVLQINVEEKLMPKVFIIADFSNGADVILAKDPINNFKQLKGKTLGIEPASIANYMFYRATDINKIDPNSINLVIKDQKVLQKEIFEGKIDAFITYPPFDIELNNKIKLNNIFDSSKIPGEIIDVIVTSKQIADERSEDLKKIVKAWQMVIDYEKEHPREVLEIIARKENVSINDLEQIMKKIKILNVKEQEYLISQGIIEKNFYAMQKILYTEGNKIDSKDIDNYFYFDPIIKFDK